MRKCKFIHKGLSVSKSSTVTDIYGSFYLIFDIIRIPNYVFNYIVFPFFFKTSGLVTFKYLIQPKQRSWHSHGIVIYFLYVFPYPVISCFGVCIEKFYKSAFVFLVQIFHNQVKSLRLQKFKLRTVRYSKRRIKIYLVYMLSYNRQTKAVYGTYICTVYKCKLPFQSLICRTSMVFFQKFFFKTFGYPFFHLQSRRLGKCHDQKLINIYGIFFISDLTDDPFNQYCCLSATCRSGYQNMSIPCIYGSLLLTSPFSRHLIFSPTQVRLSFFPIHYNYDFRSFYQIRT